MVGSLAFCDDYLHGKPGSRFGAAFGQCQCSRECRISNARQVSGPTKGASIKETMLSASAFRHSRISPLLFASGVLPAGAGFQATRKD